MDPAKNYVAYLEIKAKILQSDGQVFENLFVSIMECYDRTFKAVKPQGKFGDLKNDGFLTSTEEYFQVYAPENIEASIRDAISKITEDSKGIVENWKKVKKIYYVVNDKYKGAYPNVHLQLESLRECIKSLEELHKIEIELWTAKDVENLFFKLNVDDKAKIVGAAFINYFELEDLDYKLLSETIKYISSIPSVKGNEKLRAPNFIEKIKFNNLSESLSDRMNRYYLESSSIEQYFSNIGNYVADTLREKFNNLYEEAKDSVDLDNEVNNDLIYYYILEKAKPAFATIPVIACIEALMAYYFESCDIYEEPISTEGVI